VCLTETNAASDFQVARRRTFDCVVAEMQRLEHDLLFEQPAHPTILDGLVEQRTERTRATALPPVIGVIRRLQRQYLHQAGQTLLYSLRFGERTPAFRLTTKKADLVSWYLRLSNEGGAVPSWGVVRVELHRSYFEGALGSDFRVIDGLSKWLCDLRCRDRSYPRAAVSLEPIVRLEEHLTALLPPIEQTVAAFHLAAGFDGD
jgi:hypothetical protein